MIMSVSLGGQALSVHKSFSQHKTVITTLPADRGKRGRLGVALSECFHYSSTWTFRFKLMNPTLTGDGNESKETLP